MLCLIVERDVVVEDRVHTARAESVGDRPQKEHPEFCADRKAEQPECGHGDADRRDLTCAESVQKPVAEEAGEDRADENGCGNDSREGDRYADLGVQYGPCRPEKGIGQTEADETDVDECEQ